MMMAILYIPRNDTGHIKHFVIFCNTEDAKISLRSSFLRSISIPSYFCYSSDESSGLDWPMRFKIILGICNGLHFLHEERSEAIVHLNLKPSNIMLGDDMVPKIADFGLSRLFGEEQTRILTQNVVGWM